MVSLRGVTFSGSIALIGMVAVRACAGVDVPLNAAVGVGNSRYDGIIRCEGVSGCEGYAPPLLMNGELAMTVDRTFAVLPQKNMQYTQGLFLQGRRVGNPRRELLPQGGWRKTLLVDGREPSEVRRWEQRLDIVDGVVVCREIRDELDFEGEAFLPFGENTVAMRLVVTAKRDLESVTLGVAFLPPEHDRIVGRMEGLAWKYASYGINVVKGETALSAGPESFALKRGEKRVVERFITFSDTMRPHAGRHGSYDELRRSHVAGWEAFRAEGFVSVPDRDLQRMHDMANFHLRMNATPWSFPIGILDSHWQGNYFGFDEMYMYQGLSSSGHLTLARRAVDFRFDALPMALDRNRYGNDPKFLHYGARWMWESLEDGGVTEGTIPGEWMDHIFGVATIANCAWQQGRYVRDDAYFRKKVFPIVLEGARFFRNNWVYEDSNGDTYIGKCCDLERLGPSRDHPYLTTVGAIFTMRNAAAACESLGTNLEEAKDFRNAADRLEAWLPKKDGRYVAYIPAEARAGRPAEGIQESMAVLGGFFPFPIFPPSHEPQQKAVRHFIAEGRASGNMYPTGTNICSWYAGTMSASMSWMEDRVEPTRWLKEAFSVSGNFGEFYEINEEGCVHHPWFGTAAGNCLYAINRMLLLDRDGKTYLAFTVPADWRDYSFRLPSLEGDTVEMSVAGGKLVRLAVCGNAASCDRRFVVRPEILDGVDLNSLGLALVGREDDRATLEFRKGEENPIVEAFRSPPDCARAGVWWHWMGGQVTEDGIVRDLDWFMRMGISSATIFGMADSCTPWAKRIGNIPTDGLHPFDERWWKLLAHACREGRKRGIDIGLHNCPGYTSTGGPWIPSRLAMRELVFGVTNAAQQVSTRPNALYPVYNEDSGRFELPPCAARQTDDRLMTEFWYRPDGSSLYSPDHSMFNTFTGSGGTRHNIVEAEAFTGHPDDCSWTEMPENLKPATDDAFLNGVNRLILHTCPLQPWDDSVKPGVTMGCWGTHFGRNRLIGDEQEPPDCEFATAPLLGGSYLVSYPDWFKGGMTARPSKGRKCFSTWNYFTRESKLAPSGLLLPPQLIWE